MILFDLRFKRNNFGFITDFQLFHSLIILFSVFNLSFCLFEDQIGKFDWKQNYVGQIKYAHFDTVSTAKKLLIATEENVIAALNLKTGQILWRQVFERARNGQIQYFHVENNNNNSEIVTVSGYSPWLVRTWDANTGRLITEWSLTLTTPPVQTRHIFWLMIHPRKLVQIVAVNQSHIEITRYQSNTGQNKGVTTRIPAPWITNVKRCVVFGTKFGCTSGTTSDSQLYVLDLSTESNELKTYPLQSFIGDVSGDVHLATLPGTEIGIVFTRNDVSRIVYWDAVTSTPKTLPDSIPARGSILTIQHNNQRVLLYTAPVDKSIEINAISFDSGEKLEDLSTKLDSIEFIGTDLYGVFCAIVRNGNTACRYLLSTEDHAIVLAQNSGKSLWTREEALAHIVAVDLLDLPVSDLDASIETEFDSKEGDFVGMLTRRLSSQMKQLSLLLFTVLGGKSPQSTTQQMDLVRDDFGLHKMIVAVTRVGKLYGIDNLSGEILWQRYLKNVIPFIVNDKEQMMLYVQRTTRHFPRPAQCLLIARDKYTQNGVFYIFNPINGEPLDASDLIRTNFKVKQSMPIHKMNDEFIRPVLVLDDTDHVHVFPANARAHVVASSELMQQTFIFTADTETGLLTGYTLAFSNAQNLIATRTWQLKLGTKEHRIKSIVSKRGLERVHSQGRVLIDRSVLYKYVNPNLVAVVTHGPDPIHKYVCNVYLVDTVSGIIVSSISHKRAREPIHVVHSENWLVYAYFNDKWRRTEIGTLELYEGKTQSNDTAFSSLSPPPQLPLVERQSYIMSAHVDTMEVTVTEKGITSKHVLMALSRGSVIEMPWMFLDPRRPATVTPEMREEGVVPYMPELPLPNEAIINYNQTLSRIRGIHTSPSGLESTCLVLVHGLDIFYTRIAPSKTFDLLKDDFDYYLIVIVLSILLLASYVTKHLASRKALKQAWK